MLAILIHIYRYQYLCSNDLMLDADEETYCRSLVVQNLRTTALKSEGTKIRGGDFVPASTSNSTVVSEAEFHETRLRTTPGKLSVVRGSVDFSFHLRRSIYRLSVVGRPN